MRFASVCSGVGTDHLAFAPLGWECAWFSEIDPFACAVLAHHFPAVPNLGDMTSISDEEIMKHGAIDLLVGGTPCQGFSVAGRGKGLADPRSQLALAFVRLVHRLAPRWVVWENVGGVRNSKHARDLVALITAFREIGYLGSFRSLDARYFGVPQRRDRVFAVFHPRDWRPSAAILFESDCVRRDLAKGRGARADIAGSVAARTRGGGGLGTDFDLGGGLDESAPEVSSPLLGKANSSHDESLETYIASPPPIGADALDEERSAGLRHGDAWVAHTLRASGFDGSEDGSGRGTPLVAEPMAFNWQAGGSKDFLGGSVGRTDAVTAKQTPAVLAFDPRQITSPDNRSLAEPGSPCHTLHEQPPAVAFQDHAATVDVSSRIPGRVEGTVVGVDLQNAALRASGEAGTLCAKGQASGNRAEAIMRGMSVRRLTPRECERLQGLPDDWTLVPYRKRRRPGRTQAPKKEVPLAKDAPRYKAIGNGIALPCLVWVGQRVVLVDELLRARIGR